MELRSDITAAASRMTSEYDVNREIRQLGAFLREGETVRRMATGIYGAGAGLLAVTDYRVLLLRDGRGGQASEGFPLGRLTSVECAPDGARASISVSDSNSTAMLRQVPIEDARACTELIHTLAETPARQLTPTSGPDGGLDMSSATTTPRWDNSLGEHGSGAPGLSSGGDSAARAANNGGHGSRAQGNGDATSVPHRAVPEPTLSPGSLPAPAVAPAFASHWPEQANGNGHGTTEGRGAHRSPEGPADGQLAAFTRAGASARRGDGSVYGPRADDLGDGFLPGGRAVNGVGGFGGTALFDGARDRDLESASATTMTFNRPAHSGPGWTGVRGIPEPAGPSDGVPGAVPISALASDSANGTNGLTGTNGRPGAPGIDSANGFSGANGTGGPNAFTGTNGSGGTGGFSGTNGTGGTGGFSGTNGTGGTGGFSGTNGTGGTGGFSGTGGVGRTNGTDGTHGVRTVGQTGRSAGAEEPAATTMIAPPLTPSSTPAHAAPTDQAGPAGQTGLIARVPGPQQSPERTGSLGLTTSLAGEVPIAQLAAERVDQPEAAVDPGHERAPLNADLGTASRTGQHAAPGLAQPSRDTQSTPIRDLDGGPATTIAPLADQLAAHEATLGAGGATGTLGTTGAPSADLDGATAALGRTESTAALGRTEASTAAGSAEGTTAIDAANVTAEGTERPKPINWRAPLGGKLNPLGAPKSSETRDVYPDKSDKSEKSEAADGADGPSEAQGSGGTGEGKTTGAKRTRWIWLGAGAAALVGLAAIGSVKLLNAGNQDQAIAPVSPVPAASVDTPTGPVVQVSKVISGDQIEVTGQYNGPVVVLGIVSPSGNNCGASESKQYAADTLNHQTVTLLADSTQPDTDSSGRKLAYLELPNKADYSTQAAGAGMAKYFDGGKPVQNATQIKAAQSVAEEDKDGLWGPPCNGKFASSGSSSSHGTGSGSSGSGSSSSGSTATDGTSDTSSTGTSSTGTSSTGTSRTRGHTGTSTGN
jgi:endonuclease YncB( thermonuclease family)